MIICVLQRDNWEATGCIDMDCPGFILTDPDFPLGSVPLHPVSIYGGQQYEMSVSIRQVHTILYISSLILLFKHLFIINTLPIFLLVHACKKCKTFYFSNSL